MALRIIGGVIAMSSTSSQRVRVSMECWMRSAEESGSMVSRGSGIVWPRNSSRAAISKPCTAAKSNSFLALSCSPMESQSSSSSMHGIRSVAVLSSDYCDSWQWGTGNAGGSGGVFGKLPKQQTLFGDAEKLCAEDFAMPIAHRNLDFVGDIRLRFEDLDREFFGGF